MNKVELLAPAGNLECLKIAIDNGADAVYIGGQDFSARAYAENFSREEIIEGIKYAHIKSSKVYVTINTQIYDNEIDRVIEFVDFLYLNDVDAVIVSDFGLINLLRNRYPKLSIHVSTQFNAHNLWQVKLLESLNINRVVLARETELSTIKYIKNNSDIEIEVFAHGALCISYSGNCLHSSFIGKRSGNRGTCAQPCRMEYTLLDNDRPVGTKKYLLSTKDLNTLENIDKLIDSNVSSLKIEGRMKSKEYVALVAKTYREAIDNYYENKINKVDHLAIENMKLVFSRGFTKGFMFYEKNSDFTNTFRPSHIGVKIGKVISTKNNKVQIKLSSDIKQKDKIAIVQDRFDDIRMFLSKIYVKNKLVPMGYKDETIELVINSKVSKDADVYKIVDNDLMESINETYLKNAKKIPLRAKFISNVNEPIALILKDNNNHSVLVKSEYVVEKANNSPTTPSKIEEQLNKLNNTAYYLNSLNVVSDEQGIIPVKFINDLRREAILKMDEARATVYNRQETDIVNDVEYIKEIKSPTNQLKVKVKNIFQLQAISELNGISAIYYDDVDTYELAKNSYPSLNIIPVLPRIINDKSKSSSISNNSVVINNYGDLLKHEGSRIVTDLYMNVANKLSVYSLCKYNVESITLSPELNRYQIKQLINDFSEDYGFIPPLEMVVYGHYQTMIMKHCFIAKEYGFSGKHCGACKNKKLALLDRMHYTFPITTDSDCNVTIYNSKAIHLIEYIDDIFESGISSIRLDFSVENPQEVYEITKAYLDMMIYHDYNLNLNDVTYGYYLDNE